MFRKWDYVKTRQHDSSGISDPTEWIWNLSNGIYYPIRKAIINDTAFHAIQDGKVIAIGLYPDGMVTLQGMDRDELTKRIIKDYPLFTQANKITYKHYGVFSDDYGKKYYKKNCKYLEKLNK